MKRKNEIVQIELIQSKIYTIRNQKVIIDRDLAELYGVDNKRLNEQVKRNKNFIPEDFVFQLTKTELNNLRSQNATANISPKSRALPYVFTEYGAIHIAHFLKSQKAKQVSIYVTRAFVQMRQMIFNYKRLKEKIETMEKKYDKQFQIVFAGIKQILEIKNKPKSKIGFKTK